MKSPRLVPGGSYTPMITRVMDSEAVATSVQPRAATRNPFFAVVSGVILLIVISGFTPTLYLHACSSGSA